MWQSGMAFFTARAAAWCAELSSGPDNPTAMHSGAKRAVQVVGAEALVEALHDISCLARMYRSRLVAACDR
jgi:hypothetical protein